MPHYAGRAVNCGWIATWAPAGTQPDLIAGTPEELAATMKQEIAVYSKIIRSRNIRLQ